MTNEQSPLLANEGNADARDKAPRHSRVREIGLFVWALVATAAVIIISVWAQHVQQTHPHHPPHKEPAAKRNLVFMVSDGMGPASLSLTRSFRQHVHDLPIDDVLTLDSHFWGTSRTRSTSSLVTDSAAGATAFSCGRKSYNGAISVTADKEPCGTVLEAAKRAGYKTGLVVTTAITDATPACFASHVLVRTMQDEIALQEIGDSVLNRTVDLMLGGGRCHFLPNSTAGSCRNDDVDVVQIAEEQFGWTYTDDRNGFDALDNGNNVDLPFLGLFAHGNFPFEMDRRHQSDKYPSLPEMATTALRALEKATEDSDQGFFIMIEGSRIDHAAHINDPAAQVHEVIEYDETFKAVLDFIAKTDTETVLVSTSDHETGGLATAIQEPGHDPVYGWYPKALHQAKSSCEYLAHQLREHVRSTTESKKKLKSWVNKQLIIPGLGVKDATDEELERIVAAPLTEAAIHAFAAVISLRAHVGWSTHGHTAVDVNVYSSGGPSAQAIHGNVENTDVGKFLRDYLDVNVEEITEELKARLTLQAVSDAAGVTSYDTQYHSSEAI